MNHVYLVGWKVTYVRQPEPQNPSKAFYLAYHVLFAAITHKTAASCHRNKVNYHFTKVLKAMNTSLVLLLSIAMLASLSVDALVVSNELRRFKTSRSFSPNPTMYTPVSPTPSAQTRKSTPLQLSPSVLSSCDTLPAFHTAHGLLSPETVMRLEKTATKKSPELNKFLTTYRRDGPMSCLCMLSDPEILPHLTTAMRDLL